MDCISISNYLPGTSWIISGVSYVKNCASTVQDYVLFSARYFVSESPVGSLLQSSDGQSSSIIAQIPTIPSVVPHRYLEVGPGTGPVTEKLVALLRENDILDLVEYDATFSKLLREKYLGDKRVAVYKDSILEWNSNEKYDAIISTVPFNLFTTAQVQECFDKYRGLLKENGTLSYVEVAFLRTINKLRWSAYDFFYGTACRDEFDKILEVKDRFFANYGVSEVIAWGLQPLRVFHCKV